MLPNWLNFGNSGSGGGGPTLADTVTTETTAGQASNPGAAATASRGDHTHGTPAAPAIYDAQVGLHLSSPTHWTKVMGLFNQTIAMAVTLPAMVANKDYAYPLPVLNGTEVFHEARVYVDTPGGANSKIRLALYPVDVHGRPSGLIIQSAELPADVAGYAAIAPGGAGFQLLATPVHKVLVVCSTDGGSGVWPKLYGYNGSPLTWLGMDPGHPVDTPIGHVQWDRAYGAFPANYNGTFGAVSGASICAALFF
jgi:hypothetical protein